jgi:hypothetical protein
MKKMFVVLALAAFIAGTSGFAFSFTFDDGYFSTSLEVNPHYNGKDNGRGSAPNSGDGVPDGSGWDDAAGKGRGSAPNSGDGVSDGSGWDDDPWPPEDLGL